MYLIYPWLFSNSVVKGYVIFLGSESSEGQRLLGIAVLAFRVHVVGYLEAITPYWMPLALCARRGGRRAMSVGKR